MHSIITKITHSIPFKDAIGVARGLFRVISHNSSQNLAIRQTVNHNLPSKYNLRNAQIINHLKESQINHKKIQINQNQIQNRDQIKLKAQNEKLQPLKQVILQKLEQNSDQKQQIKNQINFQRKQSEMISSRFGRILEYGKLGKWMLQTQVAVFFAKNLGSGNQQNIYQEGAKKITEELCKMRGAPLKVAQMLSIQEDNLIPTSIRKAFEKARQQAHIMPENEVQHALKTYLGDQWRSKFTTFQKKPFAAASIGQVHKATSLLGTELAVKIQYPGVEKSIVSDIKNIKMLLKIPGVLPKGIFLDKLLANTQKQLKQECDYERQAKMHSLYDKCLKSTMRNQYKRFLIPKIENQISNKNILSSHYLQGIKLSRFQQENIPQDIRDQVGRLLLRLTFSQIFEMGIMQSDPNPSNFTYNLKTKTLNLYDFGATHIYNQQFLNHYCKIIQASVNQDKEGIIKESILTGFLTNQQNNIMIENHVDSVKMLGEPMRYQGVYDFGNQNITEKIYKTIPKMLKNRLKSPPQEVYSLHRKLSGAYLACIRMKSKVNCKKLFSQLNPGYRIKDLI